MSEGKYGRLFTESDVWHLLHELGVPPELATRAVGELHGSFPPDEPLFLLRGQDKAAWASVEHYAVHCDTMAEVSAEHASVAHDAAEEFREWQCANPDRVKVPD